MDPKIEKQIEQTVEDIFRFQVELAIGECVNQIVKAFKTAVIDTIDLKFKVQEKGGEKDENSEIGRIKEEG